MQVDQIFLDKLLSGDRRTLGKAITLVESGKETDQNLAQTLLQTILPKTGNSFRLGISGVPGVGKSTFIENFGQLLISKGHKVAVLAVDPSSPLSGGSILADKTRMEKLSQMENAFIRPSPSSGFLGGVAQKTREAILLCEAAGYDYIIVETVGVGQSEFEVSSMVDFFMLLQIPNAGDEIQGIKKGVLELADLIVINKADGSSLDLAKRSQNQLQSALEFFHQAPDWKTKVVLNSSLDLELQNEIFDILQSFFSTDISKARRKNQMLKWFDALVMYNILNNIFKNQSNKKLREKLEADIMAKKMTVMEAANTFIKKVN